MSNMKLFNKIKFYLHFVFMHQVVENHYNTETHKWCPKCKLYIRTKKELPNNLVLKDKILEKATTK